MHSEAGKHPKLKRLEVVLAVFKFNNYPALKRDVKIIFADGFAVILFAIALPVLPNSPRISPNRINWTKNKRALARKFHTTQCANCHVRPLNVAPPLTFLEEILVLYKAPVPSSKHTEKPSKFSWQCFSPGEKRHKTELVCLQYESYNNVDKATQVLAKLNSEILSNCVTALF